MMQGKWVKLIWSRYKILIQDIIPAADVPLQRFKGKVPEKELEQEAGPPQPGSKWFNAQNKVGYKKYVKKAQNKWPEIHNLFWEEHLIQEDLTHADYKKREQNWHQVWHKFLVMKV